MGHHSISLCTMLVRRLDRYNILEGACLLWEEINGNILHCSTKLVMQEQLALLTPPSSARRGFMAMILYVCVCVCTVCVCAHVASLSANI